uniref:Retrotransposon gag domain-containing protein n=1 Tax=Sinocyclocheilus rhinocerous TaxID=307959 RepID=A0A673GPD4_9TELE
MSLLPLNPPPPFLECPGEPKLTFTAWKRQFDNYLLAIGGDKFPDERKRALLIHCLGGLGARLYNTLPLEHDEYSGTVSALSALIQPKVNVVAERYRFRQRAQHVGESTDHYIAALRELVATCAFGTFENEMLRDQLIEKTSVPRIRERLLLESDLTLDKALEIARQIETASAEAKTILPENDVHHPTRLKRRTVLP